MNESSQNACWRHFSLSILGLTRPLAITESMQRRGESFFAVTLEH